MSGASVFHGPSAGRRVSGRAPARERLERRPVQRARSFAGGLLRRVNRLSSALLCLWAMVAVVGMFVPAHYGLRPDIKLFFGIVLPVADLALRVCNAGLSLRR